MLKTYSKPVLTCERNSAYLENIKFEIGIAESIYEQNCVKLKLNINLNSNVLLHLLGKDILYIGIKIRTNLRTVFRKVKPSVVNSSAQIGIPSNTLERNDGIKCTAYLIANKDFEYLYNEELKQYFEKTFKFQFKKEDLLAESNTAVASYSLNSEPFVSLNQIEGQDGKGLKFSIEGHNYINIQIGKVLNEAFSHIQKGNKPIRAKGVLNSIFIFDALVYAIFKLIQSKNPQNSKDKEWYKAIEFCYSNSDLEDYESFSNFIDAMIEDTDVDEIFKVAQRIVNNCIERSIVNAVK